MKQCEVCGIEFESKRADAKYCSKQCRKQAFLKRSIGTDKRSDGTDNLQIVERIILPETEFRFTIRQRPGNAEGDDNWNETKAKIRTAKYWYDVPLAAVPELQKDWPAVPEFETKFGPEPMNGRQYFLWWKNDFDTKDGKPVIYSPFPTLEKVTYVQAGQDSRRWGS